LSIRQHSHNKEEVKKLQSLADQAVARAEELRGIKKTQDAEKQNGGSQPKVTPV
jgi:hypothetical protein